MDFLTDYLADVKRRDLLRETPVYQTSDAAHVRLDGRNCLMLAANNYLGLTHCPAVQQAAIEAIEELGTGSGGARLTTGTHSLYPLLEKELAEFKGAEAAVVFNTGYMANVGVISALAGAGDVIFSDELNHASIIDGCRLSRADTIVFRHSDMAELGNLMSRTPCRGRKFIVVDGVFSMDGDIAPLDAIVELARRHKAMVMVDDAHATGVIGPGGRGTAAYFGLENKIQVQIGTLSKALGTEGGYVVGSRELIRYLINRARSFIFSTALAPATIAAARAALEQLKTRPEIVRRLLENAHYMRHQLSTAGLKIAPGFTPIIPVIVGAARTANTLAQELRKEGLIITAIRPPTVPDGTSRLRLAVSAVHTKAELAQATEIIAAAAKRLGVIERVVR
ncbi:MAG: 8-amino-7-oxononanoate synthase [Firmicutes bacterium]|nr:8-amino-7-oxononanoate synthase [Bacillota bacterium]